MKTNNTSRAGLQQLLSTGHRRMVLGVLSAVLCMAAYAQVPADPYNYSRKSSFTYDAQTGLLASETVEPDAANVALCVQTTYSYVETNGLNYGNKTSATTSNCAGAPAAAQFLTRTSTSGFTQTNPPAVTINGTPVAQIPGMFAQRISNALNQAETRIHDPRFGVPISLTGPNQLTTTWQLDDFGRKVKELKADGTYVVQAHCIVAAGVDATSNSDTTKGDPINCPIPGGSEVPSDALQFVHSEPRGTNNAKIGPFTRVYIDRMGRQIRTVTESFDGPSQTANRAGVPVVTDQTYTKYGAKDVETQPYYLVSGSSTNAGSSDRGLIKTLVDALGRPTTMYRTDPQGSQLNVDFGSYGTARATITSVAYQGAVTTTTNDAGQVRKEEKNAVGELVRVTDALNAQLAHQRDAFGNLIKTVDALGNAIVVSYDVAGHKVSMNDPDTGLWTYAYNAIGQLTWQQNPTQRASALATTMTYDALGRLRQRVEPEYTSNWYYDAYADASTCVAGVGKLCETSTTGGTSKKFVYDSYGRPLNSRTTVTSGPSFASSVSYDTTTGRVVDQTYPTGLKVSYSYTANGLVQAINLVQSTTGAAVLAANSNLWTVQTVNAWGRPELQTYGNGVVNRAAFDARTGRVSSLSAGLGVATDALNQQFVWNNLGQLTQRNDANGDGNTGAVSDTYTYDSIGRLQTYTVAAPSIPNLSRAVTLQYNALGMLLYKSDVGVYSYSAQGGVRPHALQSVQGVYNSSYLYDANGNMTSASAGKYKNITYTSFNLPDGTAGVVNQAGTVRYTWAYDENHQRIRETRVSSGVTRVTWSMHPDNQGGLAFECDSSTPNCSGTDTSNRHYLSAGGTTIGVLLTGGALPTLGATQLTPPTVSTLVLTKIEYWHKDHLGSLIATTNQAGLVTARYAYDPFGKRRQSNGNYDAFGTLVVDWVTNAASGTDRGYTGHEHLDDIGLIHMNGRIFDPLLGLFLQGDPLIQNPDNLQNYHHYGYCYNNPLSCTDPSGQAFGFDDLLIAIAIIWGAEKVGIIDAHTARQFSSIAVAFYLGPEGVFKGNFGVPQAAISGFVSGLISTGTARGAVIGGLQGMAFQSIGDNFKFTNPDTGAIADWGKFGQAVALHGVVGCVGAVMGGSKCGPGAMSAAFSKAAVPMTGKMDPVLGTAISAVIGGTASVLGGGKFANGAVTAAYGYLFNQVAHKEPVPVPTPPPEVQTALAVLQPLADRAAANVDATCDWRCSIPFVGDSIRGTLIHSEFERLVNASPYAGFTTEQSYLNGVPVVRGTPDSSRADVVYGPVAKPIVAFDLKTGFWSTLSYDQAVQYGKNLPKGTYLTVIKPK